MRALRLYTAVLAFGLAFPLHAQDRAATLATADSLLRAGDAPGVRALLEPLVGRNGRWHEGQYRLGRAYMVPPGADSARAFRAIYEALTRAPKVAAYLDLRLALEQAGFGMAGVPLAMRSQQRADTAARLLRADSTSARAATELATKAIADYLFQRDAVLIRDPVDLGSAERALRNPADEGTRNLPGITDPDHEERRILRARTGRFDLDAEVARTGPLGRNPDGANRYRRDALRYLSILLRHGADHRPAYDALARFFVVMADSSSLLAVTERMRTHFPQAPEAYLWRGAALYRIGQVAEAERAFNTGLAGLTPNVREAYESLSRVLSDEEARALEARGEAFTDVYWEAADPRRLTPENERRAEHLTRIVEADVLYTTHIAAGRDTELGKVYVRYGRPPTQTRIRKDGAKAPPREVVWNYGDFHLAFQDRTYQGNFEVYSPSAEELRQNRDAMVDDFVGVLNRLRRTMPERSTYAPAQREAIPFATASFQGANGQTDVVVTFGVPMQIPPERIGAMGLERDVALRARTDVALFNEARRVVGERRRSVERLAGAQMARLPEGTLWVNTASFAVAPGPHVVSAEFDAAGGTVAGFDRKRLDVRRFEPGRLALSDLLLAYRMAERTDSLSAPGFLVRGGRALLPAPVAAFRTNDAVVLYFEGYGIGGNYTVETAILPERERSRLAGLFVPERRGGISSRFEATSTDGRAAHAIRMDVASLRPGAYVLGVRLSDRATGQTVEQEHPFTLE